MKERPILFSGEMVRAILAPTKSQTRRVVSPRLYFVDGSDTDITYQADDNFGAVATESGCCPYGAPGDRLWVRETFAVPPGSDLRSDVAYRADLSPEQERDERSVMRAVPRLASEHPWTPSIHMPRWASRITLEVTAVRVERLQDITEGDAIAEGVTTGRIPADDYGPERVGYVFGRDDGRCVLYPSARRAFEIGWDTINGKRAPWSANPWVWVVAFRRVEQAEASA